jgi:hypothetical protein
MLSKYSQPEGREATTETVIVAGRELPLDGLIDIHCCANSGGAPAYTGVAVQAYVALRASLRLTVCGGGSSEVVDRKRSAFGVAAMPSIV